MARAPRKTYRKKIYRRKRYSGKSRGTNKIVKAINTGNGLTWLNRPTKIHRFVRTDLLYGILTPTAGVASYGGKFTFRLGNVPFSDEFTNLFQKYRIEKIKLIFNLVSTLDNSSVQPTLYLAKEMELNSVTPTESSIEQQSGCSIMQFSNEHRTFTRTLYPYIAVRTLTSSTVAADTVEFSERRKGMWISCGDTSGAGTGVIHHGMVYYLDYHVNTLDINDFKIEVNCEYHLAFKGTD